MFNSSFPVALANYMRDRGIKAKYIQLDKNLNTRIDEIDIGDVYGASGIKNEDLHFGFEERFEPYQRHSYEAIPGIDLIVKKRSGEPLRPLEVKLTVIPDNSTKKREISRWGAEMVIRPPTTTYCALGMLNACSDSMDRIRDIFEPVCSRIESWTNSHEICANMPMLIDRIETFEEKYQDRQTPLIMQPIWKTEGQSPLISEDAFDIFVWSDYAFTKLFLENSKIIMPDLGNVSRQMRSTARLARCLYEVSKSGKVHINTVYRQMAFNYQTDKEFSVNGSVTNKYMHCERLERPIISRNSLSEIILNGGEKMLMPERRFDQSIYFTIYNRK